MSRAPTRRPEAGASNERADQCPRHDDCQREQARALTRLADTAEAFQAEFHELKPTLQAMGDILTKWLLFCAFVRKWFPKVGWWLLPIAVTLLSKGSSEAVDALIQAATLAAQAYVAGAPA